MRTQKLLAALLSSAMVLGTMAVPVLADGETAVAKIGDTEYPTLQAAIDAVSDNNTDAVTINVIADVAAGSGLATNSTAADGHAKNIIINFDGHTYTVENPAVGSTNTKSQAMHWAAGSTIVLQNGTITTSDNASGIKMMMQNYANLTINNMTIDASKIPVTTYGAGYEKYPVWYGKTVPMFGFNTGKAVIKGNSKIKYSSNGGSIAVGEKGGTLTINDNDVVVEGQFLLESDAANVLNISGGTYSYDPSNVTYMNAENSFINCVAGGYAATESNGVWTVAPVVEESYVAQIGDQKYTTLEGAVADASDGATITMLSNYTLSATLDVEKGIILDLNGKTLTAERLNFTSGTSVIKNGTIVSEGQAVNIYGSKTTTPVKFTLDSSATIQGKYGLCVFPARPNTVDDGYAVIDINGTIASGGIFVSGNIASTTGTASKTTCPTININNGATVVRSNDQGIAMNGYCYVNIANGATVTGREAIGVKRGVLTVNGGTLTATGEYNAPVEANNNGTEASGAAISITSNYNSFPGVIEANLNGGTYNSNNGNAVYMGHSSKNDSNVTFANGVKLNINGGTYNAATGKDAVVVQPAIDGDGIYATSITGGTFSSNVKDYVADGYAAYSENTNYKVKPVAQLNQTQMISALSSATAEKPVTIKSAVNGDVYDQVTGTIVNAGNKTFEITSNDFEGSKIVTLESIGTAAQNYTGDVLCGLIITDIPSAVTVTVTPID